MKVGGLTLGRALGLALLGLTVATALLLGLLLRRWGESLLDASERLRDAASRRAEGTVTRALRGTEAAVADLEKQARSGVLPVDDPLAVERALFALILANEDLSEATFTRATRTALEPEARFAPEGRWQVSVFRGGGHPAAIVTSFTHRRGGGFAVELRRRPPGSQAFAAVPLGLDPMKVQDPTEHLTFATPAGERRFARAPLWTDLHYAELDGHLPEAQRRVVVTVMKALEDDAGRFLGVVRAGLLASTIEQVARLHVDEDDPRDPHRLFVADNRGRLVTRLGPGQPFEDQDGDLRASARGLTAEMQAALAHPALRGVSAQQPKAAGRFEVAGQAFLLSTLYLAGAQDWRVGIVVPEDHYLGDLKRARRVLVMVSVAALALALALFGAALHSVRGSLARIVGSAARMRDFDFAPSAATSPFRDVDAVMQDLEQAKTALRAMGRYVPVDLVRQLYRTRREPELGGVLCDVTLMFSDVAGFTTLSEQLAPDELARALGRYFEVMTRAVHGSGGTVDKYIGDAVMALWNVPEPLADHPARACRAALAAQEAVQALARSPAWAGLPPFPTRIGLHRDEVMVGHFGAPDRLSYTALGDGVNLASRLEGLNKAYGTSILVSQSVRESVGAAFAFRLVDVVAVKGKTRGVRVFELRGPSGDGPDGAVLRYEEAFALYQRGDFAAAQALLEAQVDDPPSRTLAERCRRYLEEPPPPAWDGTYVAREK